MSAATTAAKRTKPARPLKVLVAGATGAIGAPLVQSLSSRGHAVVALSRNAKGPDGAPGINSVSCDVLDAQQVRSVVRSHAPDVVVSQLTSLPKELNPRTLAAAYKANNRVRLVGTQNLLTAAAAAGTKRAVVQSAAFWYAPTPGPVKGESDPLWTDAPEPIGEAVRTLASMESFARGLAAPDCVLLRYGTLYGPGTWFSRDGTVGRLMMQRKHGILGHGKGVVSFVHVEDAVAATVLAVEGSATGTFNVTDDEPLEQNDWVPAFARALGAKPPRRLPAWLARPFLGRALVEYNLQSRGASNAAAKRELTWEPRWPSPRTGFPAALAPTA